jgi:hypothetical protein
MIRRDAVNNPVLLGTVGLSYVHDANGTPPLDRAVARSTLSYAIATVVPRAFVVDVTRPALS